jgi:hypothetical protein
MTADAVCAAAVVCCLLRVCCLSLLFSVTFRSCHGQAGSSKGEQGGRCNASCCSNQGPCQHSVQGCHAHDLGVFGLALGPAVTSGQPSFALFRVLGS